MRRRCCTPPVCSLEDCSIDVDVDVRRLSLDARRVLVAAAVAVVPRPPVAHAHARQAPDHRVHGRDRADAAGAGGLPCGFSLNCEDLGLQEGDFL